MAAAFAVSAGSSGLALLPRGFRVKNAKVFAPMDSAVFTITAFPPDAER